MEAAWRRHICAGRCRGSTCTPAGPLRRAEHARGSATLAPRPLAGLLVGLHRLCRVSSGRAAVRRPASPSRRITLPGEARCAPRGRAGSGHRTRLAEIVDASHRHDDQGALTASVDAYEGDHRHLDGETARAPSARSRRSACTGRCWWGCWPTRPQRRQAALVRRSHAATRSSRGLSRRATTRCWQRRWWQWQWPGRQQRRRTRRQAHEGARAEATRKPSRRPRPRRRRSRSRRPRPRRRGSRRRHRCPRQRRSRPRNPDPTPKAGEPEATPADAATDLRAGCPAPGARPADVPALRVVGRYARPDTLRRAACG